MLVTSQKIVTHGCYDNAPNHPSEITQKVSKIYCYSKEIQLVFYYAKMLIPFVVDFDPFIKVFMIATCLALWPYLYFLSFPALVLDENDDISAN